MRRPVIGLAATGLVAMGFFAMGLVPARAVAQVNPIKTAATAAEAHYAAGRDQDCINALAPYGEQIANNFGAWRLLGLCYLRQGQPEAAIRPLTHAVALRPEEPEVLRHLAQAEQESANWSQARLHFRRLAELDPANPAAWFGWYEAARQLPTPATQEMSQARAALERLPDSVERRILRGRTARQTGQHEQALAEWQAGLKMQQGRLDLRQEMAQSLFDTGRHSEAEAEAQKLLEWMPQEAKLHHLVGLCRMEAADYAVAARHLGRAHHFAPKETGIRAALGQALLRAKRPQDAVPHLSAAASGDVDGSIHGALQQAYAALGLAQKAEEARRRAEVLRQASTVTNKL